MVIPVDVNEVDSPAALAMPKSASFTDSICGAPPSVSSIPTKMFAGFTSRCVTRCLRQAWSNAAAAAPTSWTARSGGPADRRL